MLYRYLWNSLYLVMFNHFSVTCPTSIPNYVSISGSCYYIEDTKMTYADAQLNCHSKFGNTDGILFEPRDDNTNKLVNTAAANLTSGTAKLKLLKLNNSKIILVLRSEKLNQTKTHFLSHLKKKNRVKRFAYTRIRTCNHLIWSPLC